MGRLEMGLSQNTYTHPANASRPHQMRLRCPSESRQMVPVGILLQEPSARDAYTRLAGVRTAPAHEGRKLMAPSPAAASARGAGAAVAHVRLAIRHMTYDEVHGR